MSPLELKAGPPTPLSESLRRLESLVSPYTGIVSSVEELLYAPDHTRLAKFGCEMPEGVALLGCDLGHLSSGSGGTHMRRDAAAAAALGEAAERYSASHLPESELVLATAEELGPEAVDPRRFALFREDQYAEPKFPFRPFTPATPVRWARGFSLPAGEPAYLPAQLVYLVGAPLPEGEIPIAYSTSSGMACGATLEEAILGGLLELVERDAFMLAWYNRLSLPRMDWSADAELLELERRYFAPAGLRYEFVDASAFLQVPTAFGIAYGPRSGLGALGVGACSAPVVQEAWRKALSEAFAVRAWGIAVRLEEPERAFLPDFSDVASFADHVHFYAFPPNARHAAFLFASREVRDVHDVQALEGACPLHWISAIARRLAAVGASAYAVDITSPDIRQAGLWVVNVLAPELCPLDVPYGARFLGGTRLYRAAYELGLRGAPLSAGELNPYPHPFP